MSESKKTLFDKTMKAHLPRAVLAVLAVFLLTSCIPAREENSSYVKLANNSGTTIFQVELVLFNQGKKIDLLPVGEAVEVTFTKNLRETALILHYSLEREGEVKRKELFYVGTGDHFTADISITTEKAIVLDVEYLRDSYFD